jgi:hypothetical protein
MRNFSVKINEEVGLIREGRMGTIHESFFGTVTKINGYGHIFVKSGDKEFRFTKDGRLYKEKYGPSLIDADKLRALVNVENRRKEQVRLGREMKQVLENQFTYSGSFHISKEFIELMENKLEEMKALVQN